LGEDAAIESRTKEIVWKQSRSIVIVISILCNLPVLFLLHIINILGILVLVIFEKKDQRSAAGRCR